MQLTEEHKLIRESLRKLIDDEINPHDIPLNNPGRHEAERLARGEDGTTRGNV